MTKLTSKQIIEINGVLKLHLQQLPDGSWAYERGYSDRSIARLFGVTGWHVTNLRRQIYGDMQKVSGGGRQPRDTTMLTTLLDRCVKLEQRLHAIEAFMVNDWGYELRPLNLIHPEEEK